VVHSNVARGQLNAAEYRLLLDDVFFPLLECFEIIVHTALIRLKFAPYVVVNLRMLFHRCLICEDMVICYK
jgi:hypothetical protein